MVSSETHYYNSGIEGGAYYDGFTELVISGDVSTGTLRSRAGTIE